MIEQIARSYRANSVEIGGGPAWDSATFPYELQARWFHKRIEDLVDQVDEPMEAHRSNTRTEWVVLWTL